MLPLRSAILPVFAGILLPVAAMRAQIAENQQVPDPKKLVLEVQEHQKAVDKLRESYTYSSLQTVQDVDAQGKVTKTETSENEDFFVNGHVIERTVKKNGQPLSEHEQQKETERVTKLVEKAEKTPAGQPIDGPTVSISRVLEIMELGAPRGGTFGEGRRLSSTL